MKVTTAQSIIFTSDLFKTATTTTTTAAAAKVERNRPTSKLYALCSAGSLYPFGSLPNIQMAYNLLSLIRPCCVCVCVGVCIQIHISIFRLAIAIALHFVLPTWVDGVYIVSGTAEKRWHKQKLIK